jgi:hypothetical protein
MFAAGRLPSVMEIKSFGPGLSGMESVQCVTSVINNVFILPGNHFYSALDDIFCDGMEIFSNGMEFFCDGMNIFCDGMETVTNGMNPVTLRMEFISS